MFQTLTLPPANPSLRFPIPSRRRPILPCRASVQTFPAAGVIAGGERKPASFYEILRVNENASVTEIKAAYRSLAKQYHPDAGANDESDGGDFIQIHNAYETLSDPSTRALYDMSLGIGLGLGLGGERRRSSGSSSFGYYPVGIGPRRPTRRWETDQCW